MKNFFQYLAPFAPDYSGAAAVFLETGALIVICDPGGCSGNVCGYDAPEFFKNGAAIYSAAMRDMDAIWGKDDTLIDKIVSAAKYGDFPFIALVGTPVVSVIATDLEAICNIVEERTGIPAISVDTNGMDYYDIGQKKARKAIERRFKGKYKIGATSLDSVPDDAEIEKIASELEENLAKRAGSSDAGSNCRKDDSSNCRNDGNSDENSNCRSAYKILIIHQKDAAEKLKSSLKTRGYEKIYTGSWFKGCDMTFDDEEKFIDECRNYDAVIGDPLYFTALKDFKGVKVSFPHLAVSGDLFMDI